VKPRNINSILGHLLHIILEEYAGNVDDSLLDAHLFIVQMVDDYFLVVQFFSTGVAPLYFTIAYKK